MRSRGGLSCHHPHRGKKTDMSPSGASWRDQPKDWWSPSLVSACGAALVTGLFQRGRAHQHPCNHWTHSPHSCSSALMSSRYINITECSTMGGQWFGLQSLACDRFWEQATNPRTISAEPSANRELIFAACRLWAQHVLALYTLMISVFAGRASSHWC